MLRIAGEMIGGFFGRYGKMIVIGAVVVALLGFIWKVKNYVEEAEAAKAAVPVLEEKLAKAREDARTNQDSFETCSAANEANQREAEAQRIRAMLANARAAELRERAKDSVEVVNREGETFRDRELGCPALDSGFRKWLLDGS